MSRQINQPISLVQRVQIASPCTADWNSMAGDDRSRFCGQCKLNVYNLSAMTAEEGEQLIREKEGKLCARIYRRADGTILTRDCPVGLRAVRHRVTMLAARIAAMVLFAASAAAYAMTRDRDYTRTTMPTYLQARMTVQRWLDNTPMSRMTLGVIMPPTWPSGSNGSGGCTEPIGDE